MSDSQQQNYKWGIIYNCNQTIFKKLKKLAGKMVQGGKRLMYK